CCFCYWIKRKRFLYCKHLVISLFPCIGGPAMIHSQLCKMKKIHLIRLMFWTGCPIRLSSKVASRSEEHTSELQSRFDLVCRLLLEKKKLFLLSLSTLFNC